MAKIEHGISGAVYANGPYGYRPFIDCICGWGKSEETWAEVGAAFDEHLAEAPNAE